METKYVNEFGTVIPPDVAKKAREMGCNKPRYIYKDGEWEKHDKFPASNLHTEKPTRFRDAGSAEAHKVRILEDYVVFASPTGSGSRTSKKGDSW